MGVRMKTLLIIMVSFLFAILFTTAIFSSVIFRYMDENENNDLDDGFISIQATLSQEESNLKRTSVDWSHWDDTYDFMNGINREEYVDSNMTDTALEQVGLDFMFFIDREGNLFYELTNGLDTNIQGTMIKKFQENNGMLLKSAYEIKSGIVLIDGNLFIVAISSITDSSGTAVPNGKIIIGKAVDAALMAYIEMISGGEVEVLHNTDMAGKSLAKAEWKNSEYITKYWMLHDIQGDDSCSVSLTMKRTEHRAGIFYLGFSVLVFSIVLVILLLLDMFIINKFVLERLNYIDAFIKKVSRTRDMKARIGVGGKDEISNIADSINDMLGELDLANKNLAKTNERNRTLMEATNDGYLDSNLPKKEFYISPVWKELIGYKAANNTCELYIEYIKRIHPDSYAELKEKISVYATGQVDYFEEEYKVVKANGEVIWVFHRGKVAERDESGDAIRITSTLVDITKRKKYEERITALGYSDRLTGLRNRAYIEQKFDELDREPEINYAIILGDIDGLKLINDMYGHKEGDQLICAIANILEMHCPEDVVARWGGDEFIILLQNRDREYIRLLTDKIKKECEDISGGKDFRISFSLGSAEKEERLYSEAVMSLAEERMYRSKLTEMKSSRNATIKSLEKTLYEKHSETEEHTQRIKELSVQLGKRINLSQDMLNELELLSLLHDIGKIGIPEHILMKPGKLSPEEWEIMKQHAEIGYRIAKATPELSHVANEILCHHEKYDGTGYVQGLSGNEIPLLSRIISIVDSYDVMTHKRVYKDASSRQYALDELERCSGSQFDPVLVDEFFALLREIGDDMHTDE